MVYDHGDSFPFDFEVNGIPFGSKLEVKLSPRSYPIQFERKGKYSFLRADPFWCCSAAAVRRAAGRGAGVMRAGL